MIIILLLVCIAAYIGIDIWKSSNALIVRKYAVSLENCKTAIRAVVISDLHNHSFGAQNKKLVEMISQQNPDLILMAGDMLNEDSKSSEVPVALVRELAQIAPVFYGLGNHEIAYMEEPIVKVEIFSPPEYIGSIMDLCQEKRGVFKDMTYLDARRVRLEYRLPLNEIVYDFFDELKSRTKGYASFDYEIAGYERSKLVKLDILLNGEVCDALSTIVHEDHAYKRGRMLAENLKDAIPRQLFEIPIQAAVGGKIIARETVKAVRKDVLAKCYGGDITRKKKLLEKQKEGKKRMRQVGTVEVPSEVFMEILKTNKDRK